MKHTLPIALLIVASPSFAEEKRDLGAHEHGVGELNIAVDGSTVAMEFHAPGADIVGFEYQAESDEDLSAIDAAVDTLSAPLDLFVLPDAAGCSVTQARAELETGEDHDDQSEAGHDHGHDHEDHADEAHDDHAGEEHADHEDHADEAGHTEFHAEYVLSCANPDALNKITFAYFETFANAREVEVQIVTSAGAQAFEVERDAPVLDLGPMN